MENKVILSLFFTTMSFPAGIAMMSLLNERLGGI